MILNAEVTHPRYTTIKDICFLVEYLSSHETQVFKHEYLIVRCEIYWVRDLVFENPPYSKSIFYKLVEIRLETRFTKV